MSKLIGLLTCVERCLQSYVGGVFGRVKMANHGVIEIVGIGNVILAIDKGYRLVLKNGIHVPDIRLNIMSIGKLDDEGYSNYFGEGRWKLNKGSLNRAKRQK